MINQPKVFSGTDAPIKPSRLYTCQHCEANFYGRNLDPGGLIPNHRWLSGLCAGSKQKPEGQP